MKANQPISRLISHYRGGSITVLLKLASSRIPQEDSSKNCWLPTLNCSSRSDAQAYLVVLGYNQRDVERDTSCVAAICQKGKGYAVKQRTQREHTIGPSLFRTLSLSASLSPRVTFPPKTQLVGNFERPCLFYIYWDRGLSLEKVLNFKDFLANP